MGKRLSETDLAAVQEAADEKKWEETNVSPAGVMRCCISSIADYFESLEEGQTVPVGTKVACVDNPENPNHGMTLLERGTWIGSWIAEKEDQI